jgi:hypothetical protein
MGAEELKEMGAEEAELDQRFEEAAKHIAVWKPANKGPSDDEKLVRACTTGPHHSSGYTGIQMGCGSL